MARKLKVYGGNYAGTHRVIAACASGKEFNRLTSVGRDYFCETGNEEELRIAMAEPGIAFMRRHSDRDGSPWTRHPPATTPAGGE